jgi:lipoprotein-anchoring transpeptidase ErfK/SrfK
MARDYYSIVANAVAGLERNTEADRAAVYDRARKMLSDLQQRGRLSPAEMRIESAALENAFRRIEADIANTESLLAGSRKRRALRAVPLRVPDFLFTRPGMVVAGAAALLLGAAVAYALSFGQSGNTQRAAVTPAPAPVATLARPAETAAVTHPPAVDLDPGVDGGADAELPYFFRRQPVFYRTTLPVGSIVIDKAQRFLYVVQPNNVAMRYGIGLGRECVDLVGLLQISRKVQWPEWQAPDDLIKRRPNLPRKIAGGAGNPLGARAMYLSDTPRSIHGTNAPATIGSAVPLGCFRLVNKDVIDLYDRVALEAKVVARE